MDINLAKIGIIALVDEATGYQRVRPKDELRRMAPDYKLPMHLLTIVRPACLKCKDGSGYTASISTLNLTAHGKTERSARANVEKMLVGVVQAHQRAGTVEKWLDQSGLAWRAK